MYLSKLEIKGFKSFAQKVVLEFPEKGEAGRKGITSIVGPNGSGKSNIAEAVRWVLGEQSMKALRSKKAQDIIFSGSDKKARLGLAEVSLYLDNSDRQAAIDFSEIAITRKLYRSGESEYLINNQKVRLQDILMLLAKSKFAQRTYSIIGQGMVDSILIMNQAEKKEFFDEAAGIKEFQIKRNDALNKLRSTEENLHEAEVLLAEITPRVRSLTRQVKRLERREEVEKELHELQVNYYAGLWQEVKKDYELKKNNYENLEKERLFKEKQAQEVQVELEKHQIIEKRSEVFNALQKDYQNFSEEKNKISQEIFVLKHKQSVQKPDSNKRREVSLSEVVQELEIIEKLLKELVEGGGDAQKLMDGVRQASQKASSLIRKISARGGSAFGGRQPYSQELENLQIKLSQTENNLKTIQQKINNFNAEEEAKHRQLFDLQRQFQASQSALSNLTYKTNELRVELAKLETRKEDLETEIKQENLNLGEIAAAAPKLTRGEEARAEIQRLKSQLEMIGGIDPEIQKEYEETRGRYDFLTEQSQDLREAIKSLEKIIRELDELTQRQFDASFNKINNEFQKYFKVLFNGGNAKIVKVTEAQKEDEKTEADKALEELRAEQVEASIELEPKRSKILERLSLKTIAGIEIQAVPPGKKVKNIGMLSGGERAMTAIALICGIISANPSPFVFLDEVDAALDEANSLRFAKILDDLSHKTQFVIITHNRATMHKAKVLYGVTMGADGISKLLSIKLEEAEKYER